MAKKSKMVAPQPKREASVPGCPVAWALEKRLQAIEALGLRINGYVLFMCKAGTLAGSSAEAKTNAVTAFHDRLVVLEKQLGQIQEELQLG